jgi:hypothetical protein
MRDRTVLTCMLAAIAVVIVGLVKPEPMNPLSSAKSAESRFYTYKTHNPLHYDVVVLGDSRALRAVAPDAMHAALPGLRIFNCAYNAGGLNREIYEFGSHYLDTSSNDLAIVLAVTPLTLTAWKSSNGQFREALHMPADAVFLNMHAPGLVRFFSPLQMSDAVGLILKVPPKTYYYQTFHDDGWIASHKAPVDTTEAPRLYGETLKGSTIDRSLIRDMADQIEAWRREGVRVFAFRPPTQASMAALEDSMLSFDENELAADVVAAGGVWLPFAAGGYDSYDGSHLEEESARAFSRDLAQAMASRWTLAAEMKPQIQASR